VKDLGKGMAVYVIVFNCSDGLDYKSLGRMFSGLAQAGAWGCFDEFNRIDIEVLSVVAAQILTIQKALKEKRERFLFEEQMITLKPR
jgi:dynein heavy chain, axonemal